MLVCIQQSLSHTNAGVTLDILLRACFMFVAHMHNRCRLTTVHLIAEEAIKLLCDLASCPADGSLLPRAILA